MMEGLKTKEKKFPPPNEKKKGSSGKTQKKEGGNAKEGGPSRIKGGRLRKKVMRSKTPAEKGRLSSPMVRGPKGGKKGGSPCHFPTIKRGDRALKPLKETRGGRFSQGGGGKAAGEGRLFNSDWGQRREEKKKRVPSTTN